MFRRGGEMLAAELMQLKRRTSTWVLLAVWSAMSLFFGYVLPYFLDRPAGTAGDAAIAALLPQEFVGEMVSGFPFYGGAIALMVGVLSVGSEFGWGTFKTLFTQGPGRGQVLGAKIGALAIVLVPFVIAPFAIGAAASTAIAWREDAGMVWPGLQPLVEAMLAGWVILAAWAAVGIALAVVTRGTSLAIGLGILWALMIEGLLSAFAGSISWLGWVNDLLLRANAYSLVRPLGGGSEGDGPGVFTGPYVDVAQALVMLLLVIISGLTISFVLLQRRDVA